MTQSATKLNPYLFFGGDCRQAMEFYQRVFGGTLSLSTFGDGPADAHQDPKANSEEMKTNIMHAKLEGEITLLASDNPQLEGTPTNGQFSLSLEGTDEARLKGYFEKLSENGRVTAPLTRQFWGDTFGMVTDQFNVNWMVSITTAGPPETSRM
jgi:PhnB protein